MKLIVFAGHADCMDGSDELYHESGKSCPFSSNTMQCDEHICPHRSYSCGDGQCIPWQTRMAFQRLVKPESDCFNKRNLNYMCEVSPHQPAWTLESGLCWPDKDYDDPRYPPWNMIYASKLTDEEKCEYLIRCALSKGFEHDCPCNHRNCTEMMMNVCSRPNHLILYPPEGLINQNVLIMYNYTHSMENPNFQFFLLSGGLKCRGYFFQAEFPIPLSIGLALIISPLINHVLCTIVDSSYGYRDYLSPQQNDQFCWNDSLTFNGRPYAVNSGMCTRSGECISQYRIHDGSPNCFDQQDETIVLDKNYCSANVGRHRFQCFNDQHKCLTLNKLGEGYADCSNSYDESWYGTGTTLQLQLSCSKGSTTDCHLVKAYIQQSSMRNSSNNSLLVNPQQQEPMDRIPFRHYCDSFWNLDKHVDEMPSSCQYWVCQNNQYQCRTGQCIELDWVCDGEWDCSDASDEEAILLIEKWSSHNALLSNLTSQLEKCRKRYSKSPFANICNTSFEFGCYSSRVSNPLDIQVNRPCINLTQIGDGVEDCYNAYDEKNTFTSNSVTGGMWGFHFRCGNDHISYPTACEQRSDCTQILCSNYRDKNESCSDPKDFICLEDNHCKKNARCDGRFDCLNGEDEYWCPSGSLVNQLKYRNDKQVMPRPISLYIPQFPHHSVLITRQKQLSKPIVNPRNDESFKVHSYQCNRGIAVIEMNKTRCLCPPAYYGDWCQFFSDRISVIAQIDADTLLTNTLKIKAQFLFKNKIIDDHEFTINPTIENSTKIKHRFYLLYSRSVQMLAHKQMRYFNRSDVINNHPYSVHFDVFSLEQNNHVKEFGSWHYPIYFDYLPAYRLAVVLKFPSWLGNATLDPCSQNSCNENSICMPILNQNNSYYCSCKSGYFGKDCRMYERQCETYCSANALCRINTDEMNATKTKPYCICPLNHVGPHCNLKHNDCYSNPCLNNGTCFPADDRSGEAAFMCLCSKRFYGNRCQYEIPSVHVNLNMTDTLSVRATVVQLYDLGIPSFHFFIRHQQVYNGIPSKINYYHSDIHAPLLGVLKIYENLTQPQYFILYSVAQQSLINITSSPQHCPHASLLLSKGEF